MDTKNFFKYKLCSLFLDDINTNHLERYYDDAQPMMTRISYLNLSFVLISCNQCATSILYWRFADSQIRLGKGKTRTACSGGSDKS